VKKKIREFFFQGINLTADLPELCQEDEWEEYEPRAGVPIKGPSGFHGLRLSDGKEGKSRLNLNSHGFHGLRLSDGKEGKSKLNELKHAKTEGT
jgi:hypothetical protein